MATLDRNMGVNLNYPQMVHPHQLKQSTTLRPFPRELIMFFEIARFTCYYQIAYIVSRDICANNTANWKRVINMVLSPLYSLSAIITSSFLIFVLFSNLLWGMTSRYVHFPGFANPVIDSTFHFMRLAIYLLIQTCFFQMVFCVFLASACTSIDMEIIVSSTIFSKYHCIMKVVLTAVIFFMIFVLLSKFFTSYSLTCFAIDVQSIFSRLIMMKIFIISRLFLLTNGTIFQFVLPSHHVMFLYLACTSCLISFSITLMLTEFTILGQSTFPALVSVKVFSSCWFVLVTSGTNFYWFITHKVLGHPFSENAQNPLYMPSNCLDHSIERVLLSLFYFIIGISSIDILVI